MLFNTLACVAVLGSAVLEVAATPVARPESAGKLEARDATVRDVPNTHFLHERQDPYRGERWAPVKRVPADAILPMRIGLKQRNLDKGHERLMEISDPTSEHYGKHMSAKEVVDFFAPAKDSVRAVRDWLTSSGIAVERITLSANKQWVQFDATTEEAEALLLAEYYEFEHHATGIRDLATTHYHLPYAVRDHVDYVTPGIRLRSEKRQVDDHVLRRRSLSDKKKRSVQADHLAPEPVAEKAIQNLPPLNSSVCDYYVTPYCVKSQYNIPESKLAAPGNELGIFESLNDHYNKKDLDEYFARVYPTVPQGTYPIEKLIDGAVGNVAQEDAGSESDLDFQASIPIIYPQQTVLFQTDDERIQFNMTNTTYYKGFWNTFYDAIDGSYCTFSAFGETGDCDKPECMDPQYPDPLPGGYNGTLMCGVYEPTNVISISYGGGEADIPGYYSLRQCAEILKLGLQGVTVVISSGDYGVASFPGDPSKSGCAGKDEKVFYPATDATCPYVLAVGSTEFNKPAGNTTYGPGGSKNCKLVERATARFPSGGGFSNVFDAPLYQIEAVANYFATVQLPFKGYLDPGFNFTGVGDGVFKIGGRGYPDVAAIGDRYVLRNENAWWRIGGTSLAAPVWASIINIINEERIAIGKRTLGFINPVLYQHPEVFNDITVGSNPGCGTDGFPAAKGWDPVSGLGSPKFPKLKSLLVGLP